MNNTTNDSVLNAAGRFSRFSYLGWNGLLLLVMMLLGIIVAIALPQFFSRHESRYTYFCHDYFRHTVYCHHLL